MNNCPYCGSSDTFTFYEANMPNILSACPQTMLTKVKVFQFAARLCKKCMLGYNSNRLDDSELSLIYDNYLYISPLHGIGYTKYTGLIETIKQYLSNDDKILDIGCADGYLLKTLRDLGYNNLFGIEPGPQANEASKLGLNITNDYFTENTFPNELFDGFILSHIFEHFSDPFVILDSIQKKLSPNGLIIIEIPYFNGYHHQHLFFYNLNFLFRLCHDKVLKIIDYNIKNNILRVVIAHQSNNKFNEIIIKENQNDILMKAIQNYEKFKKQIEEINEIIKQNIGKKIYWWGTGILSVLYLNQINKDVLDKVDLIIVDGDKNKNGYFVPGVNIEVKYYDLIKNNKVDYIIIASTFDNEIKKTMDDNNIFADKIKVIEL